jgi:hypothetical protein
MKDAYLATPKYIEGYHTKKNKGWLTEEIWKKIEDRKDLKQKILNTKSSR